MYQIKNEPNTAYQKRRTTDPITENPNENTMIGVFEEDQKNKNPIEDPLRTSRGTLSLSTLRKIL